jgi:hypothetical protein
MPSMICALYSSPMSRKKRMASSRVFTERVTGICSFTIFSISAWMASRSSGVKGRSYAKS